MQDSAIGLILQAGPVVKFAILILLFFSVVSWAIIFLKHRYLSKAQAETQYFLNYLHEIRDLNGLASAARRYTISPVANIFTGLYAELSETGIADINRSISRLESIEAEKMGRYIGFLATTGSSTPFIGLFGTVWGIMDSFRGIGATGAASLAVVAPGIAEALIATAMGLVAAIPAVIAFNYYSSRARRIIMDMEMMSDELINVFSGAEKVVGHEG